MNIVSPLSYHRFTNLMVIYLSKPNGLSDLAAIQRYFRALLTQNALLTSYLLGPSC